MIETCKKELVKTIHINVYKELEVGYHVEMWNSHTIFSKQIYLSEILAVPFKARQAVSAAKGIALAS